VHAHEVTDCDADDTRRRKAIEKFGQSRNEMFIELAGNEQLPK
jgi:hypothetical protein